MDGWMDRHGDGYRQGLDNNKYKIKNGWPVMETDAGML